MRRVIRINASKEANPMEVSVGLVPLTLREVGQGWQKLFWELELLQGWWWWTLWHYWVYHCHHWVTWWCFCHALLSLLKNHLAKMKSTRKLSNKEQDKVFEKVISLLEDLIVENLVVTYNSITSKHEKNLENTSIKGQI